MRMLCLYRYRQAAARSSVAEQMGDKKLEMPALYLYGEGSDVGGGGYDTKEWQEKGGWTWDAVMKNCESAT